MKWTLPCSGISTVKDLRKNSWWWKFLIRKAPGVPKLKSHLKSTWYLLSPLTIYCPVDIHFCMNATFPSFPLLLSVTFSFNRITSHFQCIAGPMHVYFNQHFRSPTTILLMSNQTWIRGFDWYFGSTSIMPLMYSQNRTSVYWSTIWYHP